jgi:hypothetical protein
MSKARNTYADMDDGLPKNTKLMSSNKEKLENKFADTAKFVKM